MVRAGHRKTPALCQASGARWARPRPRRQGLPLPRASPEQRGECCVNSLARVAQTQSHGDSAVPGFGPKLVSVRSPRLLGGLVRHLERLCSRCRRTNSSMRRRPSRFQHALKLIPKLQHDRCYSRSSHCRGPASMVGVSLSILPTPSSQSLPGQAQCHLRLRR